MTNSTQEIKNLLVDKGKDSLSWDFKGQHVEIMCPNVDQAIVSVKQKAIVALIAKNDIPILLKAFTLDGVEIFQAAAPSPFNFYYLSNHPEVDISVVCITENPIDGWRDWHFGIDVKKKEIFRHCPAY